MRNSQGIDAGRYFGERERRGRGVIQSLSFKAEP
jgi:hypothetical protein